MDSDKGTSVMCSEYIHLESKDNHGGLDNDQKEGLCSVRPCSSRGLGLGRASGKPKRFTRDAFPVATSVIDRQPESQIFGITIAILAGRPTGL